MNEDFFEFEEAIIYLKNGRAVSRAGWNGKNQWVKAQFSYENSKMNLPYLYLSTVKGDLVPWTPSPSDLFADDWHKVSVP